ncbi:hypothetical protein J6590_041809 [Homalodisca vitripennis]|nr:hypothetical protein J6590_041809 [Homalodisca vitripennis]
MAWGGEHVQGRDAVTDVFLPPDNRLPRAIPGVQPPDGAMLGKIAKSGKSRFLHRKPPIFRVLKGFQAIMGRRLKFPIYLLKRVAASQSAGRNCNPIARTECMIMCETLDMNSCRTSAIDTKRRRGVCTTVIVTTSLGYYDLVLPRITDKIVPLEAIAVLVNPKNADIAIGDVSEQPNSDNFALREIRPAFTANTALIGRGSGSGREQRGSSGGSAASRHGPAGLLTWQLQPNLESPSHTVCYLWLITCVWCTDLMMHGHGRSGKLILYQEH